MNPEDADFETRLARLRPTDPPDALLHRLHAAEPDSLRKPEVASPFQSYLAVLSETAALFRPWPVAYAGLLAAWLLVLALRLATPEPPPQSTASALALTSPAADPLPASIGSFSVNQVAFLTRNSPADPSFQ